MYNSTCIYLVLVYILVKNYIRCLLFICKLFKGLKMIKFIMSNLQREPPLFQQGPGTAIVTRHISRWWRREIQKWKIALRKPRFVYLQLWAQLVETVVVPFKVSLHNNCVDFWFRYMFTLSLTLSRLANLLFCSV